MERRKEDISEEKESQNIKNPLLLKTNSSNSQGGFTTLPFILANEGFERAASSGLEPNMIVYLMSGYGMEMATASNLIFLWNAASNFAPSLGAFLADTFVGRFRMIGFGSILSLMGTTLLWSTTIIPGARPSCDGTTSSITCTSSSPFQLILLCFSFGLMSIGSGGIRSSTLAFGADQLVSTEEDGLTLNKDGVLERFFNWYYFSVSFAVLFSVTCVVYIQDHMGWNVGFGVPLILMLLSVMSFFLASSFYVKPKPKSSLFTGYAQVLVASWRNRKSKLPSQHIMEKIYHGHKESTLEKPTEKFRFLNKACLVKDPQQELALEEAVVNPWNLCTIDQVEEFKTILKIIPIWSTGIIFGVNANQISFRVLQANAMDRHIFSSSFEIPAGSFGTFALLTVILWLVLYDRVIIPLASRVKGKSTFLDTKARMGIGLILLVLSLVVAAIVESFRREKGSEMSALWLVPQICILGLAEALCAIAQIEFFYSAFPSSMSSISSNLWGLSMGFASLSSSIIMTIVDRVSKRYAQDSWVSSDVNKGRYDYYYCVLACLGTINYVYFVVCSRAYWKDNKVSGCAQEASDG